MNTQTQQATEKLSGILTTLPEQDQLVLRPILEAMLAHSDTPASTSLSSGHGAFVGGLICHTYEVWRGLAKLAAGLLDTDTEYSQCVGWPPEFKDREIYAAELASLTPTSILKVALIHDLNKLQTLSGRPYYVANVLQSGKLSDKKPWKTTDETGPLGSLKTAILGGNTEVPEIPIGQEFLMILDDDAVTMREGLISLAVARQISPNITFSPAERAAILFHDGAYAGRTGLAGNEHILQILLHASDVICSRFIC